MIILEEKEGDDSGDRNKGGTKTDKESADLKMARNFSLSNAADVGLNGEVRPIQN